MGEKPLSIDEAAVPTTTSPPDLSGAAGIITTRSNIKHAGGVTTAEHAGQAMDRPPPIDGGDGGIAADGEPIPGIDTKGRLADAEPGGIAIKEQGVKYGEAGGDAAAAGDAPGVVGANDPIPGIDVIVRKPQ